MRLMKTNNVEMLIAFIRDTNPDVLIIEGHDGAGKGRVIKEVVRNLGMKVYRPDYGHWNNYVSTKKRWLIGASFFDLISLVGLKEPFMFDRCMLSGAVYERDITIAETMARHGETTNILHVIVDTDRDSYYKMQGVRLGSDIPKTPYGMFRGYLDKFIDYADATGIKYVLFENEFNVKVGNKSMGSCGGCDNWSTSHQDYDSEKLVGRCSHWNREVFEDDKRCEFYQQESDNNE